MEEKQLFDKYQEGRHWESHPTVYAERYVAFLKEEGFEDLLVDIGCGSGRDVLVFQQNGIHTLGIDYSTQEIENARLRHPNSEFAVRNVERINFEDNSVGAYFMINVIHYVKKQQALDELLRTLKPRGYLFIHFNIDITDEEGNVDYHHGEKEIYKSLSKFQVKRQRVFERVDTIPKKHTHKILEVILQKN